MKKTIHTITTIIRKKQWDVEDYYLVVPEVQVFAHEGFSEGDTVDVIIKKRTPNEKGD